MPAASTLLRRACLCVSIALSCGAAFAAQPAAAPAAATSAGETLPAALHDLDAYVERVREQFDVPGISVAIVKDGEVVLERGYGVRKLGEPATVDQHTPFAIRSEEHTSELQSLMRNSYDVFCLKKKKKEL